jgi:hypothetical protein
LGDLEHIQVEGPGKPDSVLGPLIVIHFLVTEGRAHLELPGGDQDQLHADRIGDDLHFLLALTWTALGRQEPQVAQKNRQGNPTKNGSIAHGEFISSVLLGFLIKESCLLQSAANQGPGGTEARPPLWLAAFRRMRFRSASNSFFSCCGDFP